MVKKNQIQKLIESHVGSLVYLTNTRPEVMNFISLICRFINKPSKHHFAEAKRILHYLQGSKKLGIKYVKEVGNKLVGFADSDWAGSLDDRKSTSTCFLLGIKCHFLEFKEAKFYCIIIC